MSHEARAPAVLVPGLGSHNPHNLAVKLELDLGVRKQTRPLADLGPGSSPALWT